MPTDRSVPSGSVFPVRSPAAESLHRARPLACATVLAVSLLIASAVAAQDAAGDPVPPGRRPAALQRMIEARQRIERAEIHWYTRYPRDPGTRGEPFRYVSRLTRGETALALEGTSDRAANFDEHGNPKPNTRRSLLLREKDHWELEVDELQGRYTQNPQASDRRMTDARTIGLFPNRPPLRPVDEAVWSYPEDVKGERVYRERVENGLHIVEMEIPESGTTVRWEIDPAIDWNPLRVTSRYRDLVISESVAEYEQIDGVWFPRAVTFRDAAGDLLGELVVESARINAPELPEVLTPDHIGFKTGHSVLVSGANPQAEGMTYVAGGELLPDREYLRKLAAGEIKQDPDYAAAAEALLQRVRAGQRERERAQADAGTAAAKADGPAAGAQSATSRPAAAGAGPGEARPAQAGVAPAFVPNRVDDEWERYTREFIARYKLDRDQSAAAMRILRDCQEQRTGYLNRQQERIRRLEDQAAGPKKEGDDEWIVRELDELLAPIECIFEQQLKPRLERLPTRAQRAAAKGAASAQPRR